MENEILYPRTHLGDCQCDDCDWAYDRAVDNGEI